MSDEQTSPFLGLAIIGISALVVVYVTGSAVFSLRLDARARVHVGAADGGVR